MTYFLRLAALLSLTTVALSFPEYASLAGLPQAHLDAIIPTLVAAKAEPPPPPLNDTSAKLVNDRKHPWKPLRHGDIRGPCPGLNTLASHGWLPRSGIATPGQIVEAVQEGFNMGNDLAIFVTYAAFLVDGNPITNLLSIGGKTPRTGPDPPKPAIVGGLNTHAVFEGDASMTRNDALFGDNYSFNETLFEQLEDLSNRFGGGYYNLTVASELRYKLIQQSIATNPEFSMVSPRYYTAYGETVFPVHFFVDGRKADMKMDMTTARGFFQHDRMPEGFYRTNRSLTLTLLAEGVKAIFEPHPVPPGYNQGLANYVPDPTSADFTTFCLLYTNFVNETVRSLYPNPQGILRKALNHNLDYFYAPIKQFGCEQIFPYGKP